MSSRFEKLPGFLLAGLVLAVTGAFAAPDETPGATHAGAVSNLFLTFGPRESSSRPTPQKRDEALHSPESRPANQDPEGHWGPVSEGFQLSVRFERKSFRPGEPIIATLLIRNATDRTVHYRDFLHDLNGNPTDAPVSEFVVLDEHRRPVPRLGKAPGEMIDGPHTSQELNPGTQRKYQAPVNARFDLSAPGKYFVRVRRKVHKLQDDGYAEVSSETAEITRAAF